MRFSSYIPNAVGLEGGKSEQFADLIWMVSHPRTSAGVAELVDAPDLGSGAERRGGSSPFTRTIFFVSQALKRLDAEAAALRFKCDGK